MRFDTDRCFTLMHGTSLMIDYLVFSMLIIFLNYIKIEIEAYPFFSLIEDG